MALKFLKFNYIILMFCFFVAIVALVFETHVFFHYNLPAKGDDKGYSIHDSSINGIRKYCNFLEDIQLHHENSFDFQKHNLTLSKVMILIRHGDRGPLKDIQRLKEIRCKSTHTEDQYRAQDEDTLAMTERFFDDEVPKFDQNQQKNSFRHYLSFPDDYCKIGQLSRFGVAQHIKLGYLLGQSYLAKLGVDEDSDLSRCIVVKTTPYPRTFQSALAFLYGLGQPFGLHPSDLMPLFNDRHNVYLCDLKKFAHLCNDNCAQLLKLRSKIFQSFSFIQDEDYGKTIDTVQKIIATNSNDWDRSESVVMVFDALNLYVCHKEKLPCNKDVGCLKIDHVARIYSFIEERGEQIRDSEESSQFCWMQIYAFLLDLIETAKSVSTGKIFLYSAHDLTIQTLAIALDFFDGPIPPYASRVVFEVYHDQKGSKLLRIIYNGQDVTRDLKLCRQGKSCPRYGATTFLVDTLALERFVHHQFEEISQHFNCSK